MSEMPNSAPAAAPSSEALPRLEDADAASHHGNSRGDQEDAASMVIKAASA